MIVRTITERFAWLLCLIAVMACDNGNEGAYDDLRETAPLMCKDYCEAKVACERPSAEGPDDDDAFTASVHVCIVGCTAYKNEGMYIYTDDPLGISERYYEGYVPGDELISTVECLYNSGAYRCVLDGSEYYHRLNPPTPGVCDLAFSCLDTLELDLTTRWIGNSSGIGGTCSVGGSSFLDAEFF